MDYKHRLSIKTPERTYRIGEKALTWSDSQNNHEEIPFETIATVHLQYGPSRTLENCYLLTITTTDRRKFILSNQSFI